MSHRDQSAVEEDASLGKAGIGADWKDAHPLWNAEVLLILQHHQTATAKEETPRTQSAATQKLLQETLQYVRSLNNYHSQAAVDEAMLSVRNKLISLAHAAAAAAGLRPSPAACAQSHRYRTPGTRLEIGVVCASCNNK